MAWSNFLHEFYTHRDPAMLAVAPPETLAPEHRALLAGCAEWWCRFFNLGEPPAWVHQPEFRIAETYDLADELVIGYCPGFALASRPERERETPPEILAHNVVCPPRNLIVL